jgi:hypothetical protein
MTMELAVRPFRMRLDASEICQLRCPLCSNTRGRINTRGYLKLNDFKSLTEKNRFIKEVEISNQGEVLLNPDLAGIMAHAHKHGIHLYCETGSNMNSLTEEMAEALVKYGLRSLFCSIDGASQETYEQYRVGGNFATVIENIRRINSYKKQYQTRFPLLTWQFIVFPHNRHEIARAKAMAGSLGMGFYTKTSRRAVYTTDDTGGLVSAGRRVVGLLDESRESPSPNPSRHACAQLWIGPQIKHNGELLGCGKVKNSWGAGNVFASGFLEVVNGEKMKHARAMVLGLAPEREDIVCTGCRRYKWMKRHGRWLAMREVNILRFFLKVRRYFPVGSRYYIEFHNRLLKFFG